MVTGTSLDEPLLTKLHKQFAHCSGLKLETLLEEAWYSKECLQLAEQVCATCTICQQYIRTPSHPVVSMPLSRSFNDVIALDLHELRELGSSVYYIHIIDLFSRFSQAEIIHNKRAKTIVNSLNKLWCFQYGVPNKILTDNGVSL